MSRRLMLFPTAAVVLLAAAVVGGIWAVGSSGTVKERWVVRDLGTLPGFRDCQATMINDRGQVVGWCNAGAVSHGFLWQHGKTTDLGPTQMFRGPAINEHGLVLGTGSKGAFLWRDGRRIWLGPGTDAVAINDRGEVVGDRRTPSAESRAFLWQNGKLVDLGTL
ncbi:MAG: HAF repeat-containing protein, partial [Actinobacteria bacterium]